MELFSLRVDPYGSWKDQSSRLKNFLLETLLMSNKFRFAVNFARYSCKVKTYFGVLNFVTENSKNVLSALFSWT